LLEVLGPDLHTATRPLRAGPLEIGARMVVARLPSGGLLVHSPVALDAGLRREVERLGPVAHLVAPNRFHHLFLAGWKEAFPEARLHGAPGLATKRKDLPFDAVLEDGRPDPDWGGVFDLIHVRGIPVAEEVVLRHRPSRTLLLTDLAFHITRPVNLPTRLYLAIGRCHGRLRATALLRAAVRDRRALRESLDRLLALDFGTITVAHGEVARGGPERLREAFDWLR